MRHQHTWVEKDRRFTPPARALEHTKGPEAGEYVNRDLYGFTTLELHCGECGDTQFRETLGNQK